MAKLTMTINVEEAFEIADELATAVRSEHALPTHLRTRIQETVEAIHRGDSEGIFRMETTGGRLSLVPDGPLLALLAGVRAQRAPIREVI